MCHFSQSVVLSIFRFFVSRLLVLSLICAYSLPILSVSAKLDVDLLAAKYLVFAVR